jgi:hypothetical protein
MSASIHYKCVPKGTLPHLESARIANDKALAATYTKAAWPYRVWYGTLEWRIAQRRYEATQAALDTTRARIDEAERTKRFTYHVVEYQKVRPSRGTERRRAIEEQLEVSS